MNKIPKLGLPVVIIIIVSIIFIAKSSVNIGYGEAGVLFKLLAVVLLTNQHSVRASILLRPGTEYIRTTSSNKKNLKVACACFHQMAWKSP
jgi:hypothetical protein